MWPSLPWGRQEMITMESQWAFVKDIAPKEVKTSSLSCLISSPSFLHELGSLTGKSGTSDLE